MLVFPFKIHQNEDYTIPRAVLSRKTLTNLVSDLGKQLKKIYGSPRNNILIDEEYQLKCFNKNSISADLDRQQVIDIMNIEHG